MQSFIEHMPKAELHVRLEGTLDPELCFTLARKYGVSLAYTSTEEMYLSLGRQLATTNPWPSAELLDLLRDEMDFYQLAMSYLIKARQQQIHYVELVFNPQVHSLRQVELGTVVRGIRRAQLIAARQLGVKSGLVMGLDASQSLDSAKLHLVMAEPYREWLQGICLHARKAADLDKFTSLCNQLREQHMPLAVQVCASEFAEHTPAAQLRQLQPQRLILTQDSSDWRSLQLSELQERLGLTLCLLPGEPSAPLGLGQLLAESPLVNLTPQAPGLRRTYLTQLLNQVQSSDALCSDQLAALMANAIETAWISDSDKQLLNGQLEAYLANYCDSFQSRATG